MRPMLVNETPKKTKAKRALLPEIDILTIKDRMELGVTLTTASKIIAPSVSVASVIRLVKQHQIMENALAREDYVLFDTIRNSLFPQWFLDGHDQPEDAVYIGQYPYGYWSEDAA